MFGDISSSGGNLPSLFVRKLISLFFFFFFFSLTVYFHTLTFPPQGGSRQGRDPSQPRTAGLQSGTCIHSKPSFLGSTQAPTDALSQCLPNTNSGSGREFDFGPLACLIHHGLWTYDLNATYNFVVLQPQCLLRRTISSDNKSLKILRIASLAHLTENQSQINPIFVKFWYLVNMHLNRSNSIAHAHPIILSVSRYHVLACRVSMSPTTNFP